MLDRLREWVANSRAKQAVIASLVGAALFAFVVGPLVKALWWLLNWLGATVWGGVSSFLYRGIAAWTPDDAGITAVNLFAGVLSGAVVGIVFAMLTRGTIPQESRPDERTGQRVHPRPPSARFLVMFALGSWLLLTASLVPSYVGHYTNASFNRRLTALGPVLPEAEAKVLRAKWVQMRNALDYQEIQKQLQSIADENGIELP